MLCYHLTEDQKSQFVNGLSGVMSKTSANELLIVSQMRAHEDLEELVASEEFKRGEWASVVKVELPRWRVEQSNISNNGSATNYKQDAQRLGDWAVSYVKSDALAKLLFAYTEEVGGHMEGDLRLMELSAGSSWLRTLTPGSLRGNFDVSNASAWNDALTKGEALRFGKNYIWSGDWDIRYSTDRTPGYDEKLIELYMAHPLEAFTQLMRINVGSRTGEMDSKEHVALLNRFLPLVMDSVVLSGNPAANLKHFMVKDYQAESTVPSVAEAYECLVQHYVAYLRKGPEECKLMESHIERFSKFKEDKGLSKDQGNVLAHYKNVLDDVAPNIWAFKLEHSRKSRAEIEGKPEKKLGM